MIPIDFSSPTQSIPEQEKFWKVAIIGLAALVGLPVLYWAIVVMVTQP